MKAAIIALLLVLSTSANAENVLTPFEAVQAAVAKVDLNSRPSGKEKVLWETRLSDVEARAEDLSKRIASGALTKKRAIELEKDLWETFRVGARIKRLLRGGPVKPLAGNLKSLPGLPSLPPLRPSKPLTIK